MHYTPPPFLHRSNSPTFVALAQQAQEAALVQNKQVQIAAGHPTKDECDSSSKTSQWPSESYGFTRLTASDRKKSKSTPSLDGSHKQDSRVGVKKKGRLSQAEQERLQILEEMRKKTPVLTDSSWIRQRSTCTIHREPIDVAPLSRHESLDNIRSSSSSSSKQFSSSSQPLSGLSGIVPYRGYSGRCSLGPGAAIFSSALKQSSWSRPTSNSPVSDEEACNRAQQCDSVSAAGLSSGETQSLELRCESDTDSSSATPVTTDSESVPAFPSDHDASQQITEETFPEDDSDTATTSSA
ncbi:hypothetical protein PDJAM_G00160890 [Pangasius djambal]|uniref:Uncharacterized protein n=1 Tax=Pangasius djambal TaxID=1691987 RepID=A0ACC5ZJX7_9TELE|nr:hypothetical protein [Pangasius djambal]